MDRFRSKITQNYPKTHCSVTLIDIAGEVETTAEGGAESCVVAAMVITGEPDEVGGAVVVHVTVAMVTLVSLRARAYPCEGDENVAVAILPHGGIVRAAYAVMRTPRALTQNGWAEFPAFVVKEPPVGGAIEGLAVCMVKRTQTEFCAISKG